MSEDYTTDSPIYGPFAPPTRPDYNVPRGHGTEHPPAGGYSVKAQDLITASHAWDALSDDLKKSWDLAAAGWGYPSIFGMHDTLYTAGSLAMEVNRVIVNACSDGAAITSLLADGLVETANDYSNTDATQGAPYRTLESRAGE